MPKTPVKVKLVGEDGNAFSIIGRVSQALRRGGYSNLVDEYRKKAMSGDHDNLLRVTMEYVSDECEDDSENEFEFEEN